MTAEVAVTGYGVFTPFGFGEEPLLRGAFAGRPAFRPVTRFDVSAFRSRHAATYDGDGPGLPGRSWDVTSPPAQYEVLAACGEAALDMAGVDRRASIPVVVGGKGEISRRGGAVRGMPAELAHSVAEALGLGHPRRTFVNACVAAGNAIVHACQLIRTGAATTVVCGGVYLLDEQVFAHFDSVRGLATDRHLRPFSTGRTGVLLGDGAAVLVLESVAAAESRGARPLALIAGWGMAGDAFHIVRPDPAGHGMAAAVTAALRRASIGAEQVSYINAHGTGTRTNDVAETAALRRALGEHTRAIPISATKSTTGHSLEGCGAVETVIGLLALTSGSLPPTAELYDVDPACDLAHIRLRPIAARPQYVLNVNASVGGVNTAILLERA